MSPDRRALLRAALLSGGLALTGSAAVWAEGVDRVLAAGDDAALLGTLATLEDSAVKVLGTTGTALSRAPLPGYAQSFLSHHRAHRDALLTALHGLGAPSPPAAPSPAPAPAGEAGVLAVLMEIEDRLLGAQYAALAALERPSLRIQVASILGVDARHAAVWRAASGLDPVPTSFVGSQR
ncbi:MAG TPA: DUF4439 domain-containing protein [Candidatus Dormibacteraeota bacterium]|nr:DUF4439 domain-containing protein [Candidatus Dormibacteraeota bacterium]